MIPRRRTHKLAFLTPIVEDQADALAQALADLPTGTASPLAELPYLHFARWVVIRDLPMDWAGAPRPRPRLRAPWLLFTTVLDRPARFPVRVGPRLLADVHDALPDAAAQVWGHCVGFPGVGSRERFVAYVGQGRVRTGLAFDGYPGLTVAEVRQAAAVRDDVAAFVAAHQHTVDPAALQREFLEAHGRW